MYFAITVVQLPAFPPKTNSPVVQWTLSGHFSHSHSPQHPWFFSALQSHFYQCREVVSVFIKQDRRPQHSLLQTLSFLVQSSQINFCTSAYILSRFSSNHASDSITSLNSLLFEATGEPSGCLTCLLPNLSALLCPCIHNALSTVLCLVF